MVKVMEMKRATTSDVGYGRVQLFGGESLGS